MPVFGSSSTPLTAPSQRLTPRFALLAEEGEPLAEGGGAYSLRSFARQLPHRESLTPPKLKYPPYCKHGSQAATATKQFRESRWESDPLVLLTLSATKVHTQPHENIKYKRIDIIWSNL